MSIVEYRAQVTHTVRLGCFTQPHTQYDSIKAVGLDIFVLPCGLLGSVESVLKTVSLFNGTNTVQNNVEFLSERKVYGPFKAFNKTQTIDKSLVQVCHSTSIAASILRQYANTR